jgi:hypothetical protein
MTVANVTETRLTLSCPCHVVCDTKQGAGHAGMPVMRTIPQVTDVTPCHGGVSFTPAGCDDRVLRGLASDLWSRDYELAARELFGMQVNIVSGDTNAYNGYTTGSCNIRWVPRHYGLAEPQGVKGDDGLQLWKAFVNMLNNQ